MIPMLKKPSAAASYLGFIIQIATRCFFLTFEFSPHKRPA